VKIDKLSIDDGRSRCKRLDCSSSKMIRELGLKRRESVLILSKFNLKLSKFYLV